MKYDHTKASWRACQLSWCLALSLRHARWHDLAVAEYPRPPSEAYSERDAPLKPCQIILLGAYQSKSPLGRSHCITEDAIPRRGNLNVRTVIIRHPVSGTLGKQTFSELTQSVKHWEAQTPLSKVKILLEKVPLLTQGKNSTWESSPSNTIAWQGRRNNQTPHCKTIYKNEGLAVEWEASTVQVWFNAVSEMMTLLVAQRPGLDTFFSTCPTC